MLLDASPTPGMVWTVTSAIATSIAAVFTGCAALFSWLTVREMKKEKQEERERAMPELAISEVSIRIEKYALMYDKTNKTGMTYRIGIGNLRHNTIRDFSHSIAVFYDDGKGGDLEISNLDKRQYFLQETKEMPAYCEMADLKYKTIDNIVTKAVGFFHVIDTFGREARLVKQINHYSKEFEDIQKERPDFMYTWRIEQEDEVYEEQERRFWGFCTIEDDVEPSIMRIIINNLHKAPEKTREFYLSFPEVRKELRWFRDWKMILKNKGAKR